MAIQRADYAWGPDAAGPVIGGAAERSCGPRQITVHADASCDPVDPGGGCAGAVGWKSINGDWTSGSVEGRPRRFSGSPGPSPSGCSR